MVLLSASADSVPEILSDSLTVVDTVRERVGVATRDLLNVSRRDDVWETSFDDEFETRLVNVFDCEGVNVSERNVTDASAEGVGDGDADREVSNVAADFESVSDAESVAVASRDS